jgi:hypothetical protein
MKTIDEVRVIGREVVHCETCEHCGGDGWRPDAEREDLELECWDCDGTGEFRSDSCTCDRCIDMCERLDAVNMAPAPPVRGVE